VIDVDGHAMAPLVEALEKARALSVTDRLMVVARTVKGKGVFVSWKAGTMARQGAERQGIRAGDEESSMNKGDRIAHRTAFGQALLDIADTYPKMVVFDADVGASTQTVVFKKAHPDRFYEMGIAEANNGRRRRRHGVVRLYAVGVDLRCVSGQARS